MSYSVLTEALKEVTIHGTKWSKKEENLEASFSTDQGNVVIKVIQKGNDIRTQLSEITLVSLSGKIIFATKKLHGSGSRMLSMIMGGIDYNTFITDQ